MGPWVQLPKQLVCFGGHGAAPVTKGPLLRMHDAGQSAPGGGVPPGTLQHPPGWHQGTNRMDSGSGLGASAATSWRYCWFSTPQGVRGETRPNLVTPTRPLTCTPSQGAADNRAMLCSVASGSWMPGPGGMSCMPHLPFLSQQGGTSPSVCCSWGSCPGTPYAFPGWQLLHVSALEAVSLHPRGSEGMGWGLPGSPVQDGRTHLPQHHWSDAWSLEGAVGSGLKLFS